MLHRGALRLIVVKRTRQWIKVVNKPITHEMAAGSEFSRPATWTGEAGETYKNLMDDGIPIHRHRLYLGDAAWSTIPIDL